MDTSELVGLTGLEPMTLRLSSACSNQLSYTPGNPRLAEPQLAALKISCAPSRPPSLCSGAAASLLLRCERRLVELRRLELLTYSLQSYRSTN